MEEQVKKKVDESWKEAVTKEKESPINEGEFFPEEPDFNFFISTLGMQASIALGDIENPLTKQKQTNLKQAKFFIDTISMLKDKTSGNLKPEEDSFLEKILYGLRMRFVEKSDKTKGES